MSEAQQVKRRIIEAFRECEYPGDAFLQGSFEGCEPDEVVGPFRGRDRWQSIDSDFLDSHSEALSFFSEGAFRFFLPAYLAADLGDELQTADPIFHLTHGFLESTVEIPTDAGLFKKSIGKAAFLNPRRFGAMTFFDYARFRLSVFAREEAAAIVAFLRFQREKAEIVLQGDEIDAALREFWLERAAKAPTQRELREHQKAQPIP